MDTADQQKYRLTYRWKVLLYFVFVSLLWDTEMT